MNSYQREQLENIRRIADHGVKVQRDLDGDYLDTFLHILNLVELMKANE